MRLRQVANTGIMNPDEALMYKESDDPVSAVLDTLPERRKFVVLARIYEEKTYREIAGDMGIGKDCARQIFEHAMRCLRHPTRLRKLERLYYDTACWTECEKGHLVEAGYPCRECEERAKRIEGERKAIRQRHELAAMDVEIEEFYRLIARTHKRIKSLRKQKNSLTPPQN